jgi:hypothetical protein
MTLNVHNLIFEIIFTEKGLRTGEVHLNRHPSKRKLLLLFNLRNNLLLFF